MIEVLIRRCDQILKEFEEILNFVVKLKKNNSVLERNNDLLRKIEYSQPQFIAAWFYSIKKQTFFSILNMTTTFLIVMIQFKLG